MKKKFNIMLCTLIGVLSACNEYDFDQEQYRNEVGLLSNSSLIYDRQVANVGQEKDTIYLVATVSGSQISPNTPCSSSGIGLFAESIQQIQL